MEPITPHATPDAETLITVNLVKPAKNSTITYRARVLQASANYMLVLARWEQPTLDLGYTTFATGDAFYEHYYADRWYNVFDIHDAAGTRKGWYCNVARPAVFAAGSVSSEDLELDVFVDASRERILTLDMDDFVARHFECHEPATHAAALAALAELTRLARAGAPPFTNSH